MADYFTEFSCLFDVGSAENVARAIHIRDRLAAERALSDECDLGFRLEPDPPNGTGALWISSDSYGEPEHVIAFVLGCAEAFDLTGRWGFVWSLTCSRPLLEGFGGGAQLIDLGARRSLAWLDCSHWLQGGLDPAFDAETCIAGSTLIGGEAAMGIGMLVSDGGAAGVAAPSTPEN